MIDEKLIEEIVRRVVQRLQEEGALEERGTQLRGSAERPGIRHEGRVLSEWDVLTAHRAGKGPITIRPKTIITPLARDRAKDLRVHLIVEDE